MAGRSGRCPPMSFTTTAHLSYRNAVVVVFATTALANKKDRPGVPVRDDQHKTLDNKKGRIMPFYDSKS